MTKPRIREKEVKICNIKVRKWDENGLKWRGAGAGKIPRMVRGSEFLGFDAVEAALLLVFGRGNVHVDVVCRLRTLGDGDETTANSYSNQ